jgi:hypothetical protein
LGEPPLGADGPRTGADGTKHRTRALKALGQVDIMSVMSSEDREGFWRAGCAPPLRPACQKATADKSSYQPCRSVATCPKVLSARPHTHGRPLKPQSPAGGGSNRPDPYLGWLGGYIKIRRGRPRRRRRTRRSTRGRSPRRRTHRLMMHEGSQ